MKTSPSPSLFKSPYTSPVQLALNWSGAICLSSWNELYPEFKNNWLYSNSSVMCGCFSARSIRVRDGFGGTRAARRRRHVCSIGYRCRWCVPNCQGFIYITRYLELLMKILYNIGQRYKFECAEDCPFYYSIKTEVMQQGFCSLEETRCNKHTPHECEHIKDLHDNYLKVCNESKNTN